MADQVPTGRRAPRLGPDERIAAHVTRRGRFVRLDPSRGRPLPALARVVGALAWLAFVAGTLRRGWKAGGTDSAAGGDGGRMSVVP